VYAEDFLSVFYVLHAGKQYSAPYHLL